MDLVNSLKQLGISENNGEEFIYKYINIFKNPNNLPINRMHLERSWYELRRDLPKEIDFSQLTDGEIDKKVYEKKSEIIPALDKKWLPKCVLYRFEPYIFTLSQEENATFLGNNLQFIESLDHLLKCNYHQFWCTILYEPSAVLALRSFILNPIPWYQARYLENEYADVYKTVFNKFLLVYERLLTFRKSPSEYMEEGYGLNKLIEKKLMNLPIVLTLAFLYKNSKLEFVNKMTSLYFNDTSQLDFQMKEVEELINQTLIVLEMIGGHVCGFDRDAEIVPISIEKRPPVFSLVWTYSIVDYLLNTLALLNTLLQFYKPAIEISLSKGLPYRLPYAYGQVYRELYEMLDDREELKLQQELCDRIFDEINLGRNEFIDVYHVYSSYCLDKTLENMENPKQQEQVVEVYLKLLTTALEDDYFICDYNMKYNVAAQNETFESCYPLDTTRTKFIVSCINKFPRQKRLQQLSKLKKADYRGHFQKRKKSPWSHRRVLLDSSRVPRKIISKTRSKTLWICSPHLGDVYNYNSTDVINAILEENLPPHLVDIPFDSIRIPPEPEPEKPVLAYKGKKPGYDDALKLLNDKEDIKALKTFVLEGVQYSNDYIYDDEYDDRYDDVPIKVADNPIEEEIPTFNPNHEDLASDTSYSSDEEYDDQGKPVSKPPENGRSDRSRMNFCEDPALVRARREAKYNQKRPQSSQKKVDVVGKAKGQGQDNSVLKARDKKTTHKSSKANHSRKSGAQWKRNKGMIPS
ncbi:hypothetical protein NQ318_022355 [Aromia moschata]|uniref:Activating signal cointegrator 1 complex subunit 2 n=1 Tax=Aromia moschata TaxID=1265417 RepID=A0AAV8Z542_9CUCU|nr:hypothetical protein NQ318_022355 [Aromia moschata]